MGTICNPSQNYKGALHGIIKYIDLKKIWKEYPEHIHNKLLALLVKFHVAYIFPNFNSSPTNYEPMDEDRILISSLLPAERPNSIIDANWTRNKTGMKQYSRVFEFSFLPVDPLSSPLPPTLRLTTTKDFSPEF